MTNPFFTLIVLLNEKTFYLFPFTLESLVSQQKEASFEVIIVDGTEGRAVLTHLPIKDVKIIKAEGKEMAVMLGQALKVARGEYLHILNPGEFYTFTHALTFMAKIISGYAFPDLVYTPRRIRHHFGQPTMDLNPLTIQSLKQGEVPVSLQAFWLKKETVVMMGGFNKNYQIHCGYDLVCRMFLAPTLRKAFVRRLLTDYEYRSAPPEWIWRQSLETARVSFNHFGLTQYLLFWLVQNCLRLFRYLWKMTRASFWKKHATA